MGKVERINIEGQVEMYLYFHSFYLIIYFIHRYVQLSWFEL